MSPEDKWEDIAMICAEGLRELTSRYGWADQEAFIMYVNALTNTLGTAIGMFAEKPRTVLAQFADMLRDYPVESVRSDVFAHTLGVDTAVKVSPGQVLNFGPRKGK